MKSITFLRRPLALLMLLMTIVFGAKAGDYVTTQVTKYDDFSYTSSSSYSKTYTINASAGDVISFDYDYYKYSSGSYYVQINGTTVLGSTSTSNNILGSGTYRYIVPSDGTYTLYFYWYGYNSGYYCKTTNIQWEHKVVSDPYGDTFKVFPDFKNTTSSTNSKSYTIAAKEGGVISFDYNYNKYTNGRFYVKINNDIVVGYNGSGYYSGTGHYTYTVPSDGDYTIELYWYGYTSGYYGNVTNLVYHPDGKSFTKDGIIVGTQSNGDPAPFLSNPYSLFESVYKASEIGGKGMIRSVSFQCYSTGSSNQSIKVYMGHKSADYFSGSSDYMNMSDLQLVYSGSRTIGNKVGWETIELDTPFDYDGERNLVVVVCKTAGTSSSAYYYYTSTSSYTSMWRQGSYSDYANPASTAYSYSIGSWRPNTKFDVMEGDSYTDENNLQFSLKEDGTATLVDGSSFEGDLEVPAEIEYEGKTYAVTAIGESAFKNNENLFSVYIPSSVTYVGNSAFSGCSALTDVNCEDGASLLQFGSDVFSGSPFVYLYMGRDFKAVAFAAGPFYNSTSLADVEFGRDVTYIPDYGFYGCSGINEIKLLDGMKYVGANAFQGCTSLTDLIVGKNVAFLGANSFAGCTSLQGVEINADNAEFMAYAFEGDNSIATVNTPSVNDWLGIRFYSGTANPLAYAAALTVDSKSIASVTVPASFHKVSDFAFYNASNIESVTFRNGVDTIGVSAFYNCMNLKSVSIPASIKLIDRNAFYSTSLSELNVPTNTGEYSIAQSAFNNIQALTTVKLGGSLMSLGVSAFRGDENLEKVELSGTPRIRSIVYKCFL